MYYTYDICMFTYVGETRGDSIDGVVKLNSSIIYFVYHISYIVLVFSILVHYDRLE
jgi:hypothetical protein